MATTAENPQNSTGQNSTGKASKFQKPKARPDRSKSSRSSSPSRPSQSVAVGATVAGAVAAVGATLFATRKQWLPKAKRLGEWIETSFQKERGENEISEFTPRGNSELPLAAAQFEPSGANAGFAVTPAS
jgi:hypothetical protein